MDGPMDTTARSRTPIPSSGAPGMAAANGNRPAETTFDPISPVPPVYLDDLLEVVRPFISPSSVPSTAPAGRPLEPDLVTSTPDTNHVRAIATRDESAPNASPKPHRPLNTGQLQSLEVANTERLYTAPSQGPLHDGDIATVAAPTPASDPQQLLNSRELEGRLSFAGRPVDSAFDASTDPVATAGQLHLADHQDHSLDSNQLRASDPTQYVIADYYPSDAGQSPPESSAQSPLEYPLKSRLSARRGGSLERPVRPIDNERPWRHSDSWRADEHRTTELDRPTPSFVDGNERTYRGVTTSSSASSPTRSNRTSLPPRAPRGVSDAERSQRPMSSIDGPATFKTPSERMPSQLRASFDRDEPRRAEYMVPPLSISPRNRPTPSQGLDSSGDRQPGMPPGHRGRFPIFRPLLGHPTTEALVKDGPQAPPLPRRASGRNKSDRDDVPRNDDMDVRGRPVPVRTHQMANDPRRASFPSNASSPAHLNGRNGNAHEIPEDSIRNTPTFNQDRQHRPQLTTRQHAPHDPSQPHAIHIHSPRQGQARAQMSGGLNGAGPAAGSRLASPTTTPDLAHVRGAPSLAGKPGMTSHQSSYDHGRPTVFPSIDEHQVPGDGVSNTALAYGPNVVPYSGASRMSSTQASRNYSGTSGGGGRKFSAQWSRTTSGGRWSDQSSIASHTRMRTTTIPTALYQQALALKPLPPPPPPSKSPRETHPLLERKPHNSIAGKDGLPFTSIM